MKKCDCEHWQTCPVCYPQGFNTDGSRKTVEIPPTREDLQATIAQQAEEIATLHAALDAKIDVCGDEMIRQLTERLTAANALIEKCEFALKSNAENGIGNYTVAEAVSAITDYQAKEKS